MSQWEILEGGGLKFKGGLLIKSCLESHYSSLKAKTSSHAVEYLKSVFHT